MNPSDFSSTLRIHHVGDWSVGRVSTRWSDSTWTAPPEVRQLIDDAWTRAMIEPNRTLFDGPMCRFESCDVGPAGVTVGMSRTSYRVFWGTNIMHPELADRFGPNVMANPIGVSPALETDDGFLLLGRRNAKVAYYPSRVHPFAGCLEPADGGSHGTVAGSSRPAAAPNLFTAVERELKEELNVEPAEIELIRLTGLVEDVRLRQPELIFRAKLRLDRSTVASRLDPAEHDAMIAVRADPGGIETFLRDPALTPVAVASLLLWKQAT